jgi:polyisoprenoid-binding protein YceI
MGTNNNSEVAVKNAAWSVDTTHTKMQFSARHMVISEVTGHFNNFDIKVDNASDDFTEADIEVSIDVNSIETGNKDRENHLKSADFFDAEKFDKITFKSTSIKKIDDEKYKLIGDFTIRDITKPIELDVTYGGTIKDPYGKTRAGFRVEGTVNRFDYNLKWNALMETGGAIVGKNIKLSCDVELVKNEE